MFDNYGIKDLFYGLNRYKFIFAAFIIICTVAGYTYGVYNMKNVTEGNFCSSVTYFVTTKEEKESQETQMFNDSKEYASNLKTMLSADFCYEYVLQEITEKYTFSELSKILGVPEDNITMSAIKGVSTATVLTDTSLVNLYVECRDRDMAVDILSAYKSFVNNETSMKPYCNILEVGGVTQQLDSEATISARKVAAIAFVAACFIVIIAVFVISLVRPTLNERADIEQYDLTVIGEIGKRM